MTDFWERGDEPLLHNTRGRGVFLDYLIYGLKKDCLSIYLGTFVTLFRFNFDKN